MDNDIEQCLRVLQEGGLILYPTDTVWGIGCDATNAAAVARVYELKKRDDHKALIVLLADERDLLQYVAGVDLAVFDYLERSERPTTVVYDGAIGFADNLVAQDGSIGIRICRDAFCRQLLRRFRKPLVSTSANISGEATPAHFREVSDAVRSGVDYVVHHRQDDTAPASSSRVIRWNRDGSVTVLRP